MRRSLSLSLSLPCMIAGAIALAAPSAHAEATQSVFHPVLDKHEINNFTYDSGFVPDGAELSLKLIAGVRDEFSLDMPGTGSYEWDDGSLVVTGDTGAGEMLYNVIAETELILKVDLFGIDAEFDVIGLALGEPLAPEFPLDPANFDPYLLQGNPTAPVSAAQIIGFNAFDTTIDVGIDVDVTLDIELEVVGVTYESHNIEFTSVMDGPPESTITMEGEAGNLALTPPAMGETTPAWGTVNGEADVVATLRFIASAGALGFDIEETFEVPLEINEDVPITIPPAQMDYEAPIEPDPTDDSDSDPSAGPTTTDDSDSTSDSNSASDTDPSDSLTDGSTGNPGTDGSASAGPTTDGNSDSDSDGTEDEGCGCAADGDSGAGGTGLALMGLALLGLGRRRRR